MPIITYKKKLNINSIDYKLTFAFKCCYDNEKHLYLKDYEQSYFDSVDFNIKIEMSGKVNSLNVSVATAILVSHISLKQK